MSRIQVMGSVSASTKAVEDAISALNSRFGSGMIVRGNNLVRMMERVSTTSITLDRAIGGGWPVARIIELFGYESSGKTLMSLVACKQFKEAYPNLRVAWIDCEHSWDPSWVERVGLDPEDVDVALPDTGNQAFDIMETLIRTGGYSLVVLDSLGAAVAQQEVERSMEEMEVGVKARMGNKGIRKVQAAINSASRSGTMTTVFLINHVYMDLSGFRPRKATPGGKGKDYFDSLKIEFLAKDEVKLPKEVDPNEPMVGIVVGFFVKKSKVSIPNKTGEFIAFITEYAGNVPGSISKSEYIAPMVEDGIIIKGGSWYTLPGGVRVQGTDAVANWLKELSSEELDGIRARLISGPPEDATGGNHSPEVTQAGESGGEEGEGEQEGGIGQPADVSG